MPLNAREEVLRRSKRYDAVKEVATGDFAGKCAERCYDKCRACQGGWPASVKEPQQDPRGIEPVRKARRAPSWRSTRSPWQYEALRWVKLLRSSAPNRTIHKTHR